MLQISYVKLKLFCTILEDITYIFFQNYDPAAIQYNRGVSKLPQPAMLLLSSIKVKHATLTSPEVY